MHLEALESSEPLENVYYRFQIWRGYLLIYDRAELAEVWYQGQKITDAGIHTRIRDEINNHGFFQVNNATMGCDPAPGVTKECSIYFRSRSGGPMQRRAVKEDKRFDFRRDIISITYGDKVIDDPCVFERFYNSWPADYKPGYSIFGGAPCTIKISNENLGGDPKLGHKQCYVTMINYETNESYDFLQDEGTNMALWNSPEYRAKHHN